MAVAATLVRSEVVGASKIKVYDVVLSGGVTLGTFDTGLEFIYHASIETSTVTSAPSIGKNQSATATAASGSVFIEEAGSDDAGISVMVYGR